MSVEIGLKRTLFAITLLYSVANAQTRTATLNFDNVASLKAQKYTSVTTFKNKVAVTYGHFKAMDAPPLHWVYSDTSIAVEDFATVVRPTQIPATGKGRWLASMQQIDFRHFGATVNDNNDDAPAFRKALAYAKKMNLKTVGWNGWMNWKSTVTNKYLDSDLVSHIYIDFPWHFEGVASHGSKVRYASQTTAIFSDFTSSLSNIKELQLTADNLYIENNNDNAHGWVIAGIQFWEGVIIEMAAGSGMYANANIVYNPDWSVKYIGNISGSRFVNCEFRMNRVHGTEIKGAEANKVTFDNCYWTGNGASGANDNGFLGNYYTGGMAHSNSSPEIHWQRSLARYNGDVWMAFKTGKLGTPKEAPYNSTGEGEWIKVTDFWKGTYQFLLDNPNIKPYDPNKKYYSGGAYNLGSDSYPAAVALHTLIACYSEADNPPSFWLASSISIGGDHGAGIVRSAHINGFWGMAQSGTGWISHGRDQAFTYMNKDGITTHRPARVMLSPEVARTLEHHKMQDKDYAEYHKRKIQERGK